MKRLTIFFAAAMASAGLWASDPMSTNYSALQCCGTMMPYPAVAAAGNSTPDSLTAVMINHVGRHGSRYAASATHCTTLREALHSAEAQKTITATGRKLLALTDYVMSVSANRWGALDSLGEAEQRAIATRMFDRYTDVFTKGRVEAVSSYSPRCMMSMYAFTHQLARLDNHVEVTTGSGRRYSALLRPFDVSTDYQDFRKSNAWRPAYDQYVASVCPTTAIRRAVGEGYEFETEADARELAMTEYYVLASLEAMGLEFDSKSYFTADELNALWSCFNLREYLQRSASTISSTPADIAAELLQELISTTDAATKAKGADYASVILRFGHAETLLPLLSLLRLPGCYYLTNYFDTVGLHWCNFEIAPMSANIQLILYRAKGSDRHYVSLLLNEQPVALIPNSDEVIVAWDTARTFMERCIPLYASVTE